MQRLLPILLLLLFPAATWADSPASGGTLVSGDLAKLVVQPEDLPTAFGMTGGEPQGPNEYAALFVRPEILASPQLDQGELFGVMVNLELADDVAGAQKNFGETSGGPSGPFGGGPADDLRDLPVTLEGADEVSLQRAEYAVQGVSLVEYRYRLRVANAVVGLMVSGRVGSDGAEPPNLATQAQRVAERQAARLGLYRK